MGSQTTIYDSIQQPLPVVKTRDTEYQSLIRSSASTKNVDPIRILFQNNGQELLNMASDSLQALSTTAECRKAQLPKVERSYILQTENDVVRVAALQLVHPVNIVLEDLLPGVELECLAEVVSQRGSSRTDLLWRMSAGGESHIVAILEYKNFRVIRYSDFQEAFTTQNAKDKALEEAKTQRLRTLLRDNAILISEQVNKYSSICKDIIVFDWHSMCVFDLDDGRDPDGAGFIYSSEPKHFRRLLLGVILKGLARNGYPLPWNSAVC